ncbi:glycerophosphodiester phosphodiesterase [Rufibacter radiotolerans]|uniref:Glycerophosphodiester phosphodiesterase n=2 Tax=Rufibacter radiotolerans TaxID=1379910 RepID=A0A0H4VRM0_9BACT|nr:glycerophosphodiester phosphodiesterase [Rufibacter radiotolerans]
MTACKTSAPAAQEKPPLPAFDLEGHRGARGLMPENTIPAMRKAIDLGMTTLEMDAHITRDNQVVIAHDDFFNPLFALTPDGKEIPKEDAKKYALYQMDYAQIKTFDVGSRHYGNFPKQQKMKAHVPLLVDLIDSVQAYLKANNKPQVFYNIETKSKLAGDNKLHPDPENFVKLLMQVVEKKKITPWVIVQSFDPRTLQFMHQKHPHVRTSLLVENKKSLEENLKTLGYTPTIYSPNYKLVTAELVKKCHDLGMKVIPWTVNTTEEINQMKALGVDGIISDYPNLLATQQQ